MRRSSSVTRTASAEADALDASDTAATAALAVAHLGLAVVYTAVGIENLVHLAFLLAILLVVLRASPPPSQFRALIQHRF
ncbi:hypothetical protein PsorP6_002341 [Peronosclerospora sorghi]|uniref:Uncharacterized protein n=1 Tax=Peronosclerospora sorghi TaxID=230839 RepID=A0ACC0WSD4_9STRA|nr:hypothetical protein PsorP6_002341 [Peronosclerospora sorghi]